MVAGCRSRLNEICTTPSAGTLCAEDRFVPVTASAGPVVTGTSCAVP